MTSIASNRMTLGARVLTSLLVLGRLEFWVLFAGLLTLAQLPAEFYLSSFGPSGMPSPSDWQNVIGLAYDIRHASTLLLFLPLGSLLMVALPIWLLLALTDGPGSARRRVAQVLALTVFALSFLALTTWPPVEVRREGFRRAADRMTPLVEAIRRFEVETGRPPQHLADLTPHYLPSIREFSVRGCYPLEYSLGGPHADWRWQLQFTCPNGMLTLDQFFFRPAGEYPTSSGVERMGEWAYFWD